MKIGYIDGPRLRRALIAGCQWAQQQREELNRINVFPVPDGDTGTNLYLTVQEGSPIDPQPDLYAIGDMIGGGRYTLRQEIGRGGAGVGGGAW